VAERGLWAYCVARASDRLPEQLPGVDPGHATTRIEYGSLAALVSEVALDEYGEDALRRNLNDFAWLERVARAHEGVLERALADATLVPLRLCTIFGDEAGVRAMLSVREADLGAALETLTGREEWTVKLLVDREALRASAGGDASPPSAEAGSGAAYMLGRRRERELRERAAELAAGLAGEVHERLRAGAVAAVIGRPQNRELSGHAGDMLLNAAYLVERGEVATLRERVAQLEAEHRALGVRLELRGPLPPYNFVPQEGA
jgi:hypothetical protein